MSTRAQTYDAVVLDRANVSDHLVRLRLGVDGFASTGIPDEWVGVVVPGQFQVRYYTVRACDSSGITLDVVLHDEGLVTEWARRNCVGERLTVTEPKGSFAPSEDAGWLILVGDLTAMPAMARILEASPLPAQVWAEVPDDLGGYLPGVARSPGCGSPATVRATLPPSSARSRGPRVPATSGWPVSPRRCAPSAST